ncbi:MAG: MFS transporter [Armatimonadota bacterium]|nr:MFS transporter [Armatimonadota bacterium]
MGPALLLSGVALFAALYAPQPMLPALERLYGAPPGSAGWGMGLPLAALVVFSPVYPRIGLPAGWTIAGGLCGVALAGTAAAFAPTMAWFVAFRFLQGAALAAVPALAFALLPTVYPDRARSLAGVLVAGNAVGGALGRVLGGVLADGLGVRAALVTLSLPALPLAALVLGSRTRTVAPPAVYSLREWPLYAVGAAILFVNLFISNLLPYRLEAAGFSQTAIGVFYVAYAAGVVGGGLGGMLAERAGESAALRIALCVALASLWVLGLAPGPLLFAGFALMLLGLFAAQGIAGGLAGRCGSGVAGTYVAAYYLGGALAGLVYPPFVAAGFSAATVLAAAVVVGVLALSRRAASRVMPERAPAARSQ